MSASLENSPPSDQLELALERSLTLGVHISEAWQHCGDANSPKSKASIGLCDLSLDHGIALRLLLLELPASAIVLLRPQFECLVRATWARHVASPEDLEQLLLAPLSLEGQNAAKRLPSVPEMVAAIGVHGPKGAGQLFARARERLGPGMNSFVHGGIHPFQRGQTGYPAAMLLDVLKNSNALSMLTLILLAELAVEVGLVSLAAALNEEFQDVLPELERFDK